MHKTITLLIMILLIKACTLGPDFQSPDIYSDAVIKNELELKNNGNLPSNWYKNLGDKSLQTLIKMGLKNNNDIANAKVKLKQSRLTAKINHADFLPQINIQSGYNYEKGSDKIMYSQDSDYYSFGFDASWELDIWGKGRRQSEADAANIKSLEYSLSNIRTLVAAEIAVNYIRMQQNMANLRMARQNANLQKQIADTIEKEYQNGLSDATAYNQSQYLLQTTLSQIPQYENNVETYKNALSVLVGVLPSEIKTPQYTSLLNDKYKDISASMRNLPYSVIRLRPDVAAAEQQLKAQNALIGKAVSELYPNVSINGVFGYASQKTSNLFSSASETYSYSPSISLPLLDWNSLQNNIEIQKQGKIAALANYKQSVLQAISELKNAFSDYEAAIKSYYNKQKALDNMQKVTDLMLKRYKSGLVKFSEVLDSQQNLIKAQEDVIATRAQIATATIAYYKASGVTIDN